MAKLHPARQGEAAPVPGLAALGAVALRPLLMPPFDSAGELGDELVESRAERVVARFAVNVRPGRDEVRGDAKRWARLELALDGHARLVDLQARAQRFELARDERGERSGGLMVPMLDVQFHNGSTLAPLRAFDYGAMSNEPFAFMESAEHAYEWLNYHHLRYFYAVAREGSISRAAEKLRTSQSALCAQVKQLESALGETLYRRSGRSIVLTDFGQLVRSYAEEIFAIGREILSTANRSPGARSLRLNLGIVDSFPKLLTLDVLRPIFEHQPPIQIACHEGKLEDLLGRLAAHRIDALLADEPPSSSARVRTFDHHLGGCGITFCAEPSLARQLRGRFPRNLHGAPMLLPMPHTALRRDLEKWFRASAIVPAMIGEFEDAALAKVVATDGVGIIAVPSLVAAEASERYGFVAIGRTNACRVELHLITAERRIEHPAVSLLASRQGALTGRRGRNIQSKTPHPARVSAKAPRPRARTSRVKRSASPR